MKRHTRASFVPVAIALLVATGWTSAANMVYLPLETQAAAVDCVLRGRVLEKTSHWLGDRVTIATTLRVQVLDAMKGDMMNGSLVEVRYLGGTTPDGIRLFYEGMPRAEVGNEIVFFLMEMGDGRLTPWAVQQSFLHVRANPDTGRPEVVRDLAGVAVLEEYLDGETPFDRMALEEMRQRVERGIHSPPAGSLWLREN